VIRKPVKIKDPRPLLTPKQIEKIAIKVVKDACSGLERTSVIEKLLRAKEEQARQAELQATNLGYKRVGNDGLSFLLDIPDYYPCSGGCRTMHYLAALMCEAGFAVATTKLNFFNPLIPVRPRALPSDIAICCDGVRMDTTGATRVCWWMLCYADVFFAGRDPNRKVRKHECCVVYMPEFLESCRRHCEYPLADDDVVYLPHIDPLWCFPGLKTIEACFYGKHAASKTSVNTCPEMAASTIFAHAVHIPPIGDMYRDGTNRDQFYGHQRTLAVLRAAKNFYTVDHNTAVSVEAALCGCKVWYVQPDGTAVEKFISPAVLRREVMNPVRDLEAAQRFGAKVLQFFKTSPTLSV
jgi:hypothetical protein